MQCLGSLSLSLFLSLSHQFTDCFCGCCSSLRRTHVFEPETLAIHKAEHLKLDTTAADAQQIATQNIRLKINLIASVVNDSLHVFSCGFA